MSTDDKQKKLEELNTEIEQKTKTLADLKNDISSRQKLLETLNSIEANKNPAESLKKFEEEIANRDKQIANLYERIDAMQKAEEAQAAKNKENKAKENQELIQSYENQKVKYVEEIQNLTIELRKKDRIFQEKCKEYDEKIQGLENVIEGLKEENTDLSKEVGDLKTNVAELTKKNEEIVEESKHLQEKVKVLTGENDTLLESNENLKKTVDERDQTTKKLGQQLAGKEDEIQKINAGSRTEIQEQDKALSEKEDLLKSKDEALFVKEKTISKLEKDLEVQTLQNAQVTKLMNTLREEKEHAVKELNNEIQVLREKLEKTSEQLTERTLAAEAEAESKAKAKAEAEAQTDEKQEESVMTPRAKRKHPVEEKEAINLESPVPIQRKAFDGEFEDRLKSIQEESHREVVKLTQLLESAEAENQEKLIALEDKERRLRELEEMNDTFEVLVQGLKKTILEVQEKMDRNTKYLIDLEKKLSVKDQEIAKLREYENNFTFLLRDKENQLSAQKLELSNKDAQILKLEKSLFSIIEELNLFKQKLRAANDKANLLTRNQNKAHLQEIASKNNEIEILKEMIKSIQGVVRTKDLEINRLKSKTSSEYSPVKLPAINGSYGGSYGGSDAFKMMGKKDFKGNMFRLSEKRTLDSEQAYSIRDYPLKPFIQAGSGYENLLSHAASHDKDIGEEIAQNFKELYQAKGTLEDQHEEENQYVTKETRMISARSGKNNKQQVDQQEDQIIETGTKRETKEDNYSSGNLSVVDGEGKKKKHVNNIFDPSSDTTNAEEVMKMMTPVKVKSKHGTKKSIADTIEHSETVTTEN